MSSASSRGGGSDGGFQVCHRRSYAAGEIEIHSGRRRSSAAHGGGQRPEVRCQGDSPDGDDGAVGVWWSEERRRRRSGVRRLAAESVRKWRGGDRRAVATRWMRSAKSGGARR